MGFIEEIVKSIILLPFKVFKKWLNFNKVLVKGEIDKK